MSYYMIEVSPAEYLKLHSGMVKLLAAIEMAGPDGMPTRAISRKHGWQTLINAEKAGYIIRKTAPNKQGGPDYVMNCLTPRGAKLLQDLGK